MAKTAFFAAASTFLVKRGPGTLFGLNINPAAGGTVFAADLVDAGAVPNLGIPSSYSPTNLLVAGPFPAAPNPVSMSGFGASFASGLTLSISSTTTVSVEYD